MTFVVFDVPPYEASTWNGSTTFNGNISSHTPKITQYNGVVSTKANWKIGRPDPTFYYTMTGDSTSRPKVTIQWRGFWFKRAKITFEGQPAMQMGDFIKGRAEGPLTKRRVCVVVLPLQVTFHGVDGRFSVSTLSRTVLGVNLRGKVLRWVVCGLTSG